MQELILINSFAAFYTAEEADSADICAATVMHTKKSRKSSRCDRLWDFDVYYV